MSDKLTLNKINLKGGKNNENVLVIDIGSSSAGVGIVRNFAGKGKMPVILKNFRSYIQFEEGVEINEFLSKSKSNLKYALDSLFNENNAFGKVDKVRVFYGAPWYKSLIKKFDKVEQKSRSYNKKYLINLLEKYRELDKDPKIVTLERRITVLKLNGYVTQNPEGKTFNKIGASLYQTLVSKKTNDDIKQIISNYTNISDIEFVSHPYSVFKVLSEKFTGKNSYTIIDVGGEVTEITIVRDNDIVKIISIPKGTHYFVRELSKKFNLDFMVASSEIELISESTLSNKKINKKYLTAIKSAETTWLKHVKETLSDNHIISLPVDIFLIVDKNYQNLVTNMLNDIDAYYNSFRFGRKPTIKHIDSDSINDLVRYEKSVKKDPFIAMEAGFLEATE